MILLFSDEVVSMSCVVMMMVVDRMRLVVFVVELYKQFVCFVRALRGHRGCRGRHDHHDRHHDRQVHHDHHVHHDWVEGRMWSEDVLVAHRTNWMALVQLKYKQNFKIT